MKAVIIVALFICPGCESSRGDTAPSAASASPETTVPSVEVVPVIAQRLDTTVRLPAEIYAYESVALYPRVSGFVDQVLVDRGSVVRKGQLLARLSAPELAAQRSEAESKLAGVRSTYERTKAAAETPGAVAKHDLEVAEATLKADEARTRSLKTLEGYLYVRAPFDGMVTERNVHPGALVGPPAGANAVPMLKKESVGHLRVTVAVPETDIGAIADNANADFVVRTWPGVKFSGVIRRVAHAVDVRTRTMPVELDYVNKDGKLAPGMFAEVIWPLRRDTASLFVPASAIVQTTDKTFVDRVRDGVIDQVPVQRGVVVKERVEVIASGLGPGDLVLKRGSEELKSGTKVQARPASAEGGAPK
jgi:membrane fusion protein (multidrug efflux system)